MKTCVSCDVTKPLTEYHKRSGMRDGHVSKCRECRSRDNREYYLENQDRVKAAHKAHYDANAGTYAASNKKWRDENRERKQSADKQWKAANRDRVRSSIKAWQQEHPDRVRAHSKAWYEANPELARSKERKRRALLADVESEPYTLQQVVDRDGTGCSLCGVEVDLALAYPEPLSRSLDHEVPISLGGPDILSNMRLAHLRCNLAKGNRVPLSSMNRTRV